MYRFVGESADALRAAVSRERAFLRVWWAVEAVVAMGSVVALALSAVLVSRDVISLGTAFLMFQYMTLLSRPLNDMVDQLETVQKANGAIVRVIDLGAIRSSISDTGTRMPPPGPLSIEFRHVGFHYGDDA
ncbi:MAG TPA: hypothetical protein PLV68_12400, partial [Ilumatobacteraceae bacterium]|nr:hypothetical protein [Ilumatobacteraceae bacterium]